MALLNEIIEQNTVGKSDGVPVGVPSSYGWYSGLYRPAGLSAPPTDFSAVTGWGQVYWKSGAPAYSNPNARIEVANARTWVHLKTGDWVLVQDQKTNPVTGSEFKGDFTGPGTAVGMSTGSNGSLAMTLPKMGYTDHFWNGARGTYAPGSIDAVYVQMDMRVTDPNLKMLANVGADWWRNSTAGFNPDFSNNPTAGVGNWVDLSTQWTTIGYFSTSTDKFTADLPPPLANSPIETEPRPTITSFSPDSGTIGDGITSSNVLTLNGKAEAGSTVAVFDGTRQIGTAKTNTSGAWTYTTAALTTGSHSFTAKATDTAGNTSAVSSPLSVKIDPGAAAPTPAPTDPLPSNPGTNLLVNGSFEATSIGAGRWGAFSSIPGWTALSGGTIELWNNLNGMPATATDGKNHGELDFLGGLDGLYQNTKTAAGQKYNLSFDARSRPGFSSSTTTMEVLWNDKVVATVPPGSSWKTYNFTVTGTGGSDKLTLREAAGQSGDGLGALYDNVKLVAVGSPTSGTLSATSQADQSLALLTQYSAASSPQPAPTGGALTQADTSGSLTQTLAQPRL